MTWVSESAWLRQFYVRAGSDYEDGGIDVVHIDCGDYCNFDSSVFTLNDLRLWAYDHLEECGK